VREKRGCRSQISGTILKLFVDFNSIVTNGQVIDAD